MQGVTLAVTVHVISVLQRLLLEKGFLYFSLS